MRTSATAVFALLLFGDAARHAGAAELAWDVYPDTWVATDALNRTLPNHDTVGDPRANRTVGVFYFLWMGQHDTKVYDLTKILADNPAEPKFGPAGAFHFWG